MNAHLVKRVRKKGEPGGGEAAKETFSRGMGSLLTGKEEQKSRGNKYPINHH